MVNSFKFGSKMMLFAGLLAGSIVVPAALTPAAQGKDKPAAASPATVSPANSPAPASTVQSTPLAKDMRFPQQEKWLRSMWGIENVHVRETASGSIIRFSYLVVDAAKAKVLNDAKANPILSDASSNEKLSVPETENAGKLRQVAFPENGREYWMVFLNNSRIVRPGSKVNIKIGMFHAEGLVVEPSMPTQSVKKP